MPRRVSAHCRLFEGLAAEGEIYRPVGALFESYDALLAPTFAGIGLLAGDDYVDSTIEIEGQHLRYFEGIMTVPFNILSRCPVLNVPSGKARNGLPTGLQIVGRTYDDVTVFRVGAAVEQALGPWRGPLLATFPLRFS